MPPSEAEVERLKRRLLVDTTFWARECAQIVDARAQRVPLIPNAAQLKFDAALEKQRAAGLPMRVIVLKARKLGFSTWTQAKIMQRITQRPNRRALVVAQDKDTAGTLFEIGERIHANLPAAADLGLKPRIAGRERGKFLLFGETSRQRREEGHMGLDSKLEVDTANEVEAGRGYTFTELHGSEVAFWPDVRKLTSLLNAVPDEPETMIVLESTANGMNHFKTRWDQAEAGESGYVPVFAAWWEHPAYRLPFDCEEDRYEFEQTVGQGEFGEAEPRLIEVFGCDLEQLHWRRKAIVDKTESDVELFKQEYPASPEEAFMAAGRHVFSMALVSKVLDRTRETDPLVTTEEKPGPDLGIFKPTRLDIRQTRTGIVEVPIEPLWTPKFETGLGDLHPFWKVWHHPDPGHEPESLEDEKRPPGAYVVAVDPASGQEQAEDGSLAFHAIQVIDHRTKQQVAEYASRVDPDLIAAEAYMAALYYNQGWLAVETTGGWGLSIVRRVYRGYGYALTYRRKSLERAIKDKSEDRLGWDTGRSTKPLLEDGARELLREGTHGINSRALASELTTYVMDENGKTGPEPLAFADRLMAWMIAQQVALEKPIPKPKSSSKPQRRVPRNRVRGW